MDAGLSWLTAHYARDWLFHLFIEPLLQSSQAFLDLTGQACHPPRWRNWINLFSQFE
jgi:hypothetical protein